MASNDSISVIKVGHTLLVTVPPDPDDSTVAELQDRTLQAMERYDAKGIILDLSKVESLDSYFARTVSETAKMVRLMGGETVIAGMRPSVAITATELGLTLGATRTALTIEHAFDLSNGPGKKGK